MAKSVGSTAQQKTSELIPLSLLEGDKFMKWDEDSTTGTLVTLRIDPNGFYLYWVDQNKEMDMLDIATIRDARTAKFAKVPKESKLRNMVSMGTSDPIEDKTITVCYGSDFVNVSFVNFCSMRKDAKETQETAKIWSETLTKLAFNLSHINSSAMTSLRKAHTKLCLQTDKADKITLKNIVKMFAQNKEDKKRVESALTDSGLSCCKHLPKVVWTVEGKNCDRKLRASIRWKRARKKLKNLKELEGLTLSQFTFEAFLQFYKNLTGRKEVEQVFHKICGGNKYLGVPAFVQFLNQTQRDPRLNEILHPYANPENALDCMKQHEPDSNNAKNGQLSLAGFLSYLMSDSNYIVNVSKLECSDNMDQPLAHYFINSSHNTYLTGHQITGKSSVEIYRQCLLSGCRCVELDLWNGTKEEPVVVHGYTFVPEISAKEVIEAIAESAFKTSDYPVILSFENHCNPKQQAKIASYCREIFGDMLLDTPLSSHKLEVGTELPPPSLLRNKIIIKNKKKHHNKKRHNAAAAGGDAPQVTDVPADDANPGEAVEGNGDVSQGHPPLGARQASKDSGDGDEDNDDDEESSSRDDDDVDVPEDGKEKNNPDKVTANEEEAVAEISALVNYVQPVHFVSFEVAEKRKRYYEMSSFDEKQATTLLKERPIEFVNYNKQQLSRVYPAGTRFDSSNLMPQIFWNAGCQLVALNYQTLDLSMQLNLGLFEYNNRCGFLLKPEFMRRNDKSFDPFAESPVDGIIAGTVSIQVLSGQFLTDKRVGTYVEVEMYGLPADTVRKRFRTKVVANNGINPVYEDEPFVFKKVVLPEIASIRLAVYEDSGKFIGHRVLPVVGLCPGYRHVGLRNEANQPLPMAQLFLMIVVKDYVPHGMSDLAEALSNPIEYHSKRDKRDHQLSVLTDGTGVDDLDKNEDKEKEVKETYAESENVNGSRADITSSAALERGTSTSTADVDIRSETSAPGGVEKLLATKRPSTALIASNVSGAAVALETAGAASSLVQSTSGDLGDDLKAESLDKLMENKAVREKKAEMEKKLEALRKKHEKERVRLQMHKGSQDSERLRTKFYMSNKLVKRLSSKNISGSGGGGGAPELATQHEVSEDREDSIRSTGIPRSQSERLLTVWRDHLKQEKELQEKYHELVFATLDKTMRASQSLQMKELKAKLDRKTEEVMRALQADRRKGIKELAKKHKDRDELIRIKREVASAMVEKGVTERVRLAEVYEMKKSDLEKQHETVREALKQKRAETEKVLEQEYEQRIATLEEGVQPGNGGDSQDTD